MVQAFIGNKVADALKQKFGTEVSVGKVNLGFLNRIIVDDVRMLDQQGDSMIYASRVSAKVDILPLKDGKISIASAQLFGLKANIYKQTTDSKTNIQFVLDSLASKDTTKHTPLNLHIGSLIIRHGSVKYDQRDKVLTKGVFSKEHIWLTDLSTHIILNDATDNNINLQIKKLSFAEQSGFRVKSLSFKLIANKHEASLKGFELQLPNSDISLGDIHASYLLENGKIKQNTLSVDGTINQSKVTLSDISCFAPIFRHFDDALYFGCRFSGTSTSLRCQQMNFKTGSGSINLQAKGNISNLNHTPKWSTDIYNLNLTEEGIQFFAHNLGDKFKLPKELERIGGIHYVGYIRGEGKDLASKGNVETGIGDATYSFTKAGKSLNIQITTPGVSIGKLLDNKQLGLIAASLTVRGNKDNLIAKGEIERFDYSNYKFHNISLNGNYTKELVKGILSINDANVKFNVDGEYSIKNKKYAVNAFIDHLRPAILGIKMADKSYALKEISISASNKDKDSYLDIEAPFINLHTKGEYDIATLYPCLQNIIADKLPSLPGIKKSQTKGNNDFTLQANIYSTEILNKMFGIPVTISSPIHVKGNISERDKDLNLLMSAPLLSYNGTPLNNSSIEILSLGNTLTLDAKIKQGLPYEQAPEYHLSASAANNVLSTLINYDNHSSKLPVKGTFNADTHLAQNEYGQIGINTEIRPSSIMLGDTKWEVLPATVSYHKNHLTVENFTVKHDDQHIIVNGKATENKEDSIVADLKDVDVAYILNLINFHSVDFTGKATGKAIVKSIFQKPDAYAKLDINDFTFEGGPLGVLHANVLYNKEREQIDILATADAGREHQTYIDGYVSPKRNYIDLGIEAAGTSLKFMESFCGSFMDNIDASAFGKLHVVGDLGQINLIGDITASGTMHMKQLGTDYHFSNLRAHAIPDDILLQGDTIYDKNKHIAVVTGGIHHKHLTRLSYDLDIKAHNFMGYDTHEFGDNTFYGTIYATGEVGIHGKSGENIIDINATPEPGSIFVYNVASPDAISDKSFIHWHDATPEWEKSFYKETQSSNEEDDDIPSDMRINFMVNTNPSLTLKLMMDNQTGDYISLNGNGVIKANYFNKGAFEMFGNYIVDHGVYKLTIQNIIKKDFEFMPGGTISFGGNPYSAPLNLKAKYILNGVPLSDLNIGRSFSSNNIRVDCLMNIKGTPSAPSVDFAMDLPTVNSDAKQMIYSLINSQEEMNQQVLYLLGVGRFFAQTKNNQASEDAAQQSQTSLAMQSILSGTISQQLNTVLSSFVNNNKWNFGANISTGDEGFNNAEYEGILTGKLLNNRLLFNGQFGYRDNANATQSFIGDFDLRYLIFPNGNLALRMYNQTNDRYFTKNSLNTQGVGLIMKKDFNNFFDLFGIKKQKDKKKKGK